MVNQGDLDLHLTNLVRHIERSKFSGYDPYDALNSKLILNRSKWIRLIATTLFRISPINLRKSFGIKGGINSKAMGLLLSSYSCFKKMGVSKVADRQEKIFSWLIENRSRDYAGSSWGYNFPWQDVNRLLPENMPSIVTTSYVVHGLLDYFETSKNEKALSVAIDACKFITEELNITNFSDSLCFSYTPLENNLVHNANMLGASVLARVSSITSSKTMKDLSVKSVNFTVDMQNSDGSWDYSLDPVTFKPRIQIDWHQGFIIDSLFDFVKYVKPDNQKYMAAIFKGAEFYRNNQITDEGQCKWRNQNLWPADVHNQAQAIITFSKLSQIDLDYIHTAEKVLHWTIDNLYDHRGFFYFQKWPFFTNKISYMRWAQSWMTLALVTYKLIETKSKYEIPRE